jgi:hypothetical protein
MPEQVVVPIALRREAKSVKSSVWVRVFAVHAIGFLTSLATASSVAHALNTGRSRTHAHTQRMMAFARGVEQAP